MEATPNFGVDACLAYSAGPHPYPNSSIARTSSRARRFSRARVERSASEAYILVEQILCSYELAAIPVLQSLEQQPAGQEPIPPWRRGTQIVTLQHMLALLNSRTARAIVLVVLIAIAGGCGDSQPVAKQTGGEVRPGTAPTDEPKPLYKEKAPAAVLAFVGEFNLLDNGIPLQIQVENTGTRDL